ncbi:MAG: DUF59 domain-containing protein, partial [Kofleriaceae bacterium]|nr:DUF59 domain-containing protein [Kofleriaceae bacterium]
MNEARVKEVLATVNDPNFNKDIVSYRIFTGCEVSGSDVLVKLELPTPVYPPAALRELTTRIET